MEDELQAEVRQFAAQLGLAPGSGGGDFSDFDPKKAKKAVAKQPSKSAPEQGKEKNGPAKAAKGGDRRPQGKPQAASQDGMPGKKWEHRGDRVQAASMNGDRSNKKRFNNGRDGGRSNGFAASETAAPQPAGSRVRSLLPRDEPGIWYEAAAQHTASLPAPCGECAPEVVAPRREAAAALLERETAAAGARQGRSGGVDAQWLQSVKRAGTTADRVASASVLVQDGALTALAALDQLLDVAAKRAGARGAVAPAIDALTELFLTVLLPDRPLRFFEQQPLAAVEQPYTRAGSLALLYMHFEDCVKKRYARFVEQLEAGSRDPLPFVKDKCIKAMHDLLVAKPEQEQRLLTSLVNKLGDPERKLASKVGFLLSRLLAAHPAMKAVVVREMERFVFRPGLTDRARYYTVVYLNQMVLSAHPASGGPELAKRLIDIYFTVFAMILDGKIGTAAGVAAARGARKRDGVTGKKARWRDRAKDGGNAAPAVAATLRTQAGELDARMLSALITGVRRAFPFVAAEDVDPLIARHADALFRLAHTRSFGVATQSLLLLHQLMSSRGAASDRFYRALYAALASPELARSTKATMFLAMLLKAVRADASNARAAAFAKRLLQVALEAPPAFACGCLILVSEFLRHRPSLWEAVLRPEPRAGDDGLERFRDVEDAEAVEAALDGALGAQAVAKARDEADRGLAWPSHPGAYDLNKRDPKFANADKSCLWELDCLAAHMHPSVSSMARSLLAGANVVYDGDPLRDLTLAAFLDKLTTRKAGAAKAKPRGGSAMQPILLPLEAPAGPDFARLSEEEVAPEDLFFARYHALPAVQRKRESRQARRARLAERGEEDVDEEASDASGSDDDEAALFLGEEEDHGEEGLGADPDAGTSFAYDQLAAAMAEDDDEDEDDSKEPSSDGEDGISGSEEEEEEDAESGDDDDFELEGASFSDMSEDEGASEEAELEDDGLDEEDDGPESSDEDDAAADAEVASLLQNPALQKASKRKDVPEDLNAFALPESSEEEEEDDEDEDEDDLEALLEAGSDEEAETKKGKKAPKRRKPTGGMDDFAPAEAYEHLLNGDDAEEGLAPASRKAPHNKRRKARR